MNQNRVQHLSDPVGSEIHQDKDTAGTVVDTSNWPIVNVTFPKNITPEALDDHFRAILELTKRDERFAMIINLDALITANPELRRHAANGLASNSKKISEYIVGVAHVTDNWLSRAVLTVVLNINPPLPYPHKTFRKHKTAESWILGLLMEESTTEGSEAP